MKLSRKQRDEDYLSSCLSVTA